MTRIAIFRFSALGDCILLLPAVRALQELMPEAKVTWIIEHNLLPLFKNIDGIEFLPIKKPRSLKDYWQLRMQLRDHEFDVLLAMQSSFRSNLIYPFIKAKRKIGFDSIRGRELHPLFVNEQIAYRQEHLLDGFMGFVTQLAGKKTGLLRWDFCLSETDKSWAAQQLHGAEYWVALNPAASKLERCCSVEFYRDVLVDAVRHFNAGILLTGGPAEWEIKFAADIEKAVRQELSDSELKLVNCVGKSTLPQLAALLERVDVLIAPDTGPIHLADALGTKVIGLYAVAPPGLTGPYQNQSLVINAYPLALKTFRNKQVSELKWGARVHHPAAMSLFKPEQVAEKLALLLAEKQL